MEDDVAEDVVEDDDAENDEVQGTGVTFYLRGHIRPYPKRGSHSPQPTFLSIQYIVQPFRVDLGRRGI